MGQKVRPTGFRVGVMETWRSRWYANKREFGDLLLEDHKIRKFVATKYAFAEIARVEIERTRDQVVVHMHTARPGVIIGRKGQEVDKLKAELEDLTGRRMDVKIVEITNPNRNARLVAMKIAQQLQKRGSFRRAIKKTLDEVMSAGVYGVKIQMSGRLGGAEMSRQEKASRGSIPLSTLRRHIDYGLAESATTMGIIGVKVWIDLGDYSNEETADGANAKAGQASKKPKRTYKR
ncbi:MAG TPA: 30S ribosomal protein S3 [Planctomycetaceae bacterium]|nr:30S ribosomal protein S3 [Planctomycetaceae bacterium]